MAYDIGTARGVIELDYNGRGAEQASADLKKIEGTGESTHDALRKVSNTAGIAGGAIAAGLAVGVNAAANFEQRMSAIEAVSGSTGAEMDKVRAKALQLGKDTVFSASEAGSAMEELVKAGLSVDDVLNGAADATVNLAAAGEIALPEAATIAANAMNQFNLKAADMVNVADKIAGAANASAIDVSEFGQSMQQAGAVANLAGVSFDDTATAIALMGNAGIKGSDAGTSLKSMFSRLQPATSQAYDEMYRLGLITYDANSAMKVLAENGIKGVAKKDAQQALQELAAELTNSEVGSAKALKKFNDLGRQTGYLSNQFYDAKGNTKGLAEVSQTLADSMKNMNARQKQATLQLLFGSDAIRAAAILSNNGAKGFNKMADSMKKVSAADVAKKRMDNFKGSLEQMKGSLETAGIAVGTILLPPLRQLVDAVSGALTWFLNLSSGMQTGVVVFAAAAAAILLVVAGVARMIIFAAELSKALAVLRAALAGTWIAALGPIALIIAAIALVVAAIVILWKKSETFRNIVTGVWNAVKDAVKSVVDWFAGVPGLFSSALEGIKGAFQAVLNWITNNWRLLITIILGPLGLVIALVTKFWPQIVAVFQAGINVVRNIWSGFWNGAFGNLLKAAFALVVAIARLGWAYTVAVFRAAFNTIRAVTSAAWNGIMGIIRRVIGIVKAIVQREIQGIKNIVNGAWNVIRAVTGAVWNAIMGVIRAVWGKIGGTVTGAARKVLGAVRDAWNTVKSVTKSIWDGIVSAIKGAVEKMMGPIKSIKDRITGFFSGAIGWLAQAGRDIIAGLIRGIDETIHKVTEKLQALTQKIKDAKGPPKRDKILLVSNGELIMNSLIKGFDNIEPDVLDKLGNLTNRLATPAGTYGAPLGVLPAPTPPPDSGASPALRLVNGELRLDESGRAFIAGVAVETQDANDDYASLLGRMG